ncbi:hypothetical protein S83_063999 [Arachis hypogaea]
MDSYEAFRNKKIQSDDEFLRGPRKSKVRFHDFIYIESEYQNSLYSHDSIQFNRSKHRPMKAEVAGLSMPVRHYHIQILTTYRTRLDGAFSGLSLAEASM